MEIQITNYGKTVNCGDNQVLNETVVYKQNSYSQKLSSFFQLYESWKPVVLNIKSYYRLQWITEKKACFPSTLNLPSGRKGLLLLTNI